jgi:hypothetical protein
VDACPTGALKFAEETELDLRGTGPLLPEAPGKPWVYCKGIPKNFIAGTLYDPETKEIVEGGTLTLSGPQASATTTTTNGWGDFWFQGLEAGTYSLAIQAAGYPDKSIADINAHESVNLGDIPLSS